MIAKASNTPDTTFLLNDVEYERGIYTLYYRNLLLDDSDAIITSVIRVGIRNRNVSDDVLTSPLDIDIWSDGFTNFSDYSTLVEYLVDLIGAPAGGITISQQVNQFSDLVDGVLVGDLAYVENSQGTSWLPSGLGGTYYPAGFYLWDGLIWESDRNAIALQLENILLDLANQELNDLTDVNLTAASKGDLMVHNGTEWVDLNVGADGTVLEAASGESFGVKWATPASGVSDHTLLTNIGTNTHAQIDTHIADSTIHFTEASIDHTNITNIGTNTHAQIDSHIADSTIHFTQAAISITESQISDLQAYLTSYTETDPIFTASQAANIDAGDITNLGNLSGTNSGDQTSIVGITGTKAQFNTALTDGSFMYVGDAPTAHTHVIADITDFTDSSANWNTAFGWGDHSGLYSLLAHTHLEADITDLQDYLVSPLTTKGDLLVYTTVDARLGVGADGQVLTADAAEASGMKWATPASGVTDHTLLTNIGTNTHAQIDTHIADATIHFTQAAISITESQISDLQSYLTAEVNDLTASVTWDDVPNANITEGSVTQHEAALSIIWSQITGEPTTLAGYGISDTKANFNIALSDGSFMFVGDAPTAHTHTESDITDLQAYLLTETDPVYTASQAFNIDAGDITNLGNLSGTNSGDQTSIVGITGTKAQFNTALTDGTFMYVGDAPTSHTHLEADITDLQAYLLDITGESIGSLSDVTITGAAKGDILVYNGSAWVDLTVGADGTVLEADAAEATGVKWATPASGVTDHTLLTNIGTNTHAQIDTHIADATIHFTQAAISITESQISDLQAYLLTETDPVYTASQAFNIDARDITNLGNLSGTNSGDQTSIVGITGTKAQFDTALTDGNFMYIGDTPTAHTHLLAAGATDVTATAAEVNLLDLAGLTAGWVLSADSATTASWKEQIGVGGFNESAIWKFDTTTTESSPASGDIRFNNATPASVTKIFINDFTNSGGDASAYLSTLQSGDVVYIQQEDDSASFLTATLTADITDNTGWFTLDVSISDSGTLITNNKSTHFAMFKGAVTVGGGDVTKVGTPVNNQIGIWTGDGTIEGSTAFTFDGTDFVMGDTNGIFNLRGITGYSDIYTSNRLTLQSNEGFKIEDIGATSSVTYVVPSSGNVTMTPPTASGVLALKSGTPVNNQIAIWVDGNQVEGDADVTWDKTDFIVGGGIVGDSLTINVNSTSTTTPAITINQAGTGDALMHFIADSQTYSLGIDNSDTRNSFVIAEGTDVGLGTRMELDFTDGLFALRETSDFSMSWSSSLETDGIAMFQSGTGDCRTWWSAGAFSGWSGGTDNSDDDSWKLGVGNTVSADTQLRVDRNGDIDVTGAIRANDNSASTTTPIITLTQSGTGDAFQTWTSDGASYSMGIDSSGGVADDVLVIAHGTDLTTNIMLEFGDNGNEMYSRLNNHYHFANRSFNTTGWYLQNAGTGDIRVAYAAGGITWSTGIDQTDTEAFKITIGGDPSTGTIAARWDSSDGALRLPPYGSGTVTGTEVYGLGVDSSGNVLEIPLSSTSAPQEQSFVATASQTNFTLTFTPSAAWVWVNGAAQDASTWSISGDDIVLSTASTVNDTVEIYYLTAVANLTVGDAFLANTQTFTGDNTFSDNSTSTTSPNVIIEQLGTGDAYMRFERGAASWSIGMDKTGGFYDDNLTISIGDDLSSPVLEFGDNGNEIHYFGNSQFHWLNSTSSTHGGYWTQAGTGDMKLTMVAGGTSWCIGVDNSDDDKYKISQNGSLGTNDVMSIDTSLNTVFSGTLDASNLSGTNTGDQTSIVGITGTKAQFDTAVTDDNFAYQSDLHTKPSLSRSVTIADPVATDDATLFFTPVAITITDVRSHITGTTNVVFNVGHAATRTGTQLDVFTSDITLTSTAGQSNNSGFSDATIPANSWVWLEVVSVSGTPTWFHGTIIYTED